MTACRLMDEDGSGAVGSQELGNAFKVQHFLYLACATRCQRESKSPASFCLVAFCSFWESR